MQLVLDKVNYVYNPNTAYETYALKDINLVINKGDIIGIIGHTGSGKSTLIQHLNGLIKATSGNIYFNGKDIYEKDYDIKQLRCKVGVVFQYPDYQLFESTVYKDVLFGPSKQNISKVEAEKRAFEAIKLAGVSETLYDVSPFELSGGQKRRVAIAGILAMAPDILVLDEPTAGLDPKSRREILDMIKSLNTEANITVILVSHSMEDVAEYVKRLVVMDNGSIVFDNTPGEVFSHRDELESMGLAVPMVTEIADELRKIGFSMPTNVTTLEEAKKAIVKLGVR